MTKKRRVFEGGSLMPSFLGGTIVGDVSRLNRQAQAIDQEKLSTRSARRDYVRQLQEVVFDGWGMQDVAVSLSNVTLNRFGNSWQAGLRLATAGSVVALGAQVSDQRTAGSCTVKVYIGGSLTDLTAAIDADAKLAVLETRPAGEVLFDVGEEITLRVSTVSSWAPVTADLQAFIVVNLEL
jgi:hypothetical protein